MNIPAGALDRVENLVCSAPGCHGAHPAVVCESIEWEPFTVGFDGATRELKFDAKYRVRSQYLIGGEVRADEHRLWPLEAKIDFGFQNVFAYQLDAGSNGPELKPVAAEHLDAKGFLAPLAAGPVAGTIGGQTVVIPVVRRRAVVVTSLVCNKPRADFEPGGVLMAARVYPLAFFVANFLVERAVGAVRLTRPAAQPPHDPTTMQPDLRVGLYTDSNKPGPLPTWDRLFAYYNVISPTGRHTVVYQRTDPPEQLGWGKSQNRRLPPADWLPAGVSGDALEKLPGQGAYDNVHIAPPMYMKPPPPIPLTGPTLAEATKSFTDIMMAPFCVHDCLHTHWRWAPPGSVITEVNQRQRMGWSLDGVPYSAPGAPLVAANQTVVVTVAGTGFHYQANIDRPTPGEWQVVMHHGSGYSIAENPDPPRLSSERARSLIVTGLSVPGALQTMRSRGVIGGTLWLPPGSTEWPLFYWHLRYAIRTPMSVMFQGQIDPGAFSERNPIAATPALQAEAASG